MNKATYQRTKKRIIPYEELIAEGAIVLFKPAAGDQFNERNFVGHFNGKRWIFPKGKPVFVPAECLPHLKALTATGRKDDIDFLGELDPVEGFSEIVLPPIEDAPPDFSSYSPLPEPISFYGWANFSGYGNTFVEYASQLNLITADSVYPAKEIVKEDDPRWELLTEGMKHFFRKGKRKTRIGIACITPNEFCWLTNPIKIGLTMTETTKLGRLWARYINAVDHVFVPSPELVPIYEKAGVSIPIHPIKLGVNPNIYHLFDRPKDRKVFTFGILSHMDQRKGWKPLVEAFCSEFAPEEPVRLLVKNTNPRFGYELPKDTRIQIIHDFLDFKEMRKFYYLLDCYVLPSRGEGFSLTTVEAMATGLPAIFTDWLGLKQQVKEGCNIPLHPVSFSPHHIFAIDDGWMGGLCANVDPAELAYWMRWMFEHQDEAREMGKRASKWVLSEFSWLRCAEEMRVILEGIMRC